MAVALAAAAAGTVAAVFRCWSTLKQCLALKLQWLMQETKQRRYKVSHL